MPYKPEVRRDELTIREVQDELVVYDGREKRAHRLNKTAAPILQASDGSRTVDQIAALLSDDMDIKDRTELVWLTLQDLSKVGLLTAAIPSGHVDRSRRNLLQRAAVIGLTLPVVESIVAQSATAHASDPRRYEHREHHSHRDFDHHRDFNRDRDRD
ncbi:MAG: PqqD family protein [Alphaproteobacteria bacterium]|nr:PqqD family protein [Alphaproteobacteria bacterium]